MKGTTMNIATLLKIRRKVDKATKRADAQLDESLAAYGPDSEKFVLGVNEESYRTILKGDYSPIYPDSIAPTVQVRVLPWPVCADAADANLFVEAQANFAQGEKARAQRRHMEDVGEHTHWTSPDVWLPVQREAQSWADQFPDPSDVQQMADEARQACPA